MSRDNNNKPRADGIQQGGGRWAPDDPNLQKTVVILLEEALKKSGLPKIRDIPIRKQEPTWRELLFAVEIDATQFSRWGNGNVKRAARPTTDRLLCLFKGETYIDRKGDPAKRAADRAFAKSLWQFWTTSCREDLGHLVDLLQAHKDKLARMEAEDYQATQERVRASLGAAAAAARQQDACPDFVLDPTPDTLPPGLRPPRRIVHREKIVASLLELFGRRAQEGLLIDLSGLPRAGKTSILQKFAVDLSSAGTHDKSPRALLHVNLGDAQTPTRAAFVAVGGRAGLRRSGLTASADNEEGDEDEPHNTELEFIQTQIRHKLGSRSLVTIVENCSEIVGIESSLRELDQIFRSSAFRRGFNVLESIGDLVSAAALPRITIPLPLFSKAQAIDFLSNSEHQPPDLAAEATKLLGEHLLHPGILHDGAVPFDPSINRISAREPSAEDLALMIMARASEIAEDVVHRLSDGECDPRAAMLSLMVMAIFGKAPVGQPLLDAAGLRPIPRERLLGIGWLAPPRGETLVGFGFDAMRAAAALTFSGKEARWRDTNDLREGARRLAIDLFGQRSDLAAALEESTTWVRRHAPNETQLWSDLQALLDQESVLDPVSPIAAEERIAAIDLFRQGADRGDLNKALAELVNHTRYGLVRSDFLKSLDSISIVMRDGAKLTARNLSALDGALYLGSRRFHLFREVLTGRQAAYKALLEQEKPRLEARDRRWTLAWLSFLMNLADMSVGLGERAEGLTSADRAKQILDGEQWLGEDSWKQWLLARLAILRARLATQASVQKAEITNAVRCAALCLASAPDDPRCIRFYLRTVRRLIEVEGDESAREQHVDTAKAHLEAVLGPCDCWDITIRAQFAALMRQEARRAWDVEYQRNRGEEALELLQTTRRDGRQDVDKDALASLVQARIQAFLGDDSAALASCENALKLEASPAAWHLKLRLLDGSGGGQQDWSGGLELDRSESSPLPPDVRLAIKEFRTWIVDHSEEGRSYGGVVLWSLEREWRAQGSLERHIGKELSRQQIDYNGLPKKEKLGQLANAFRRRQQQLKGLRRRFGDSVDLILAEFRNSSQFARSKSVLTGEPPNTSEALAVIDDGLKRFGDSHRLLFQRAEYLRYIWDVDAAIDGFRQICATGTNGDLRRRATISLIKTIHTAAVHREDEGSQRRMELLNEAKRLAEALSGSFEHAEELAILKDHVALESGDQVDWSSLDEMYRNIVGVVDGFPGTLIRNYDSILRDDIGAPSNIAQSLQRDFTNPECLGLAGLLYLRRAEQKIGNHQQKDFACAIGFLRAAALLERSWTGQEYPTTSYRIGRAILSAAVAFRTANPIEGLDREKRSDQLALAEAKFNSAASRSAGAFRDKARLAQSRASQFRLEIRRDGPP